MRDWPAHSGKKRPGREAGGEGPGERGRGRGTRLTYKMHVHVSTSDLAGGCLTFTREKPTVYAGL